MKLILLFLTIYTIPLLAQTPKPVPAPAPVQFQYVRLVSVIDGDTIKVDLTRVHPFFGKDIPVRAHDIDAPEISSTDICEIKAAKIAKCYATQFVKPPKLILLTNVERDKYFRILANIKVNKIDLSAKMLEYKLAVPYSGGTKKKTDWCATLKEIESNTNLSFCI